MKVEMNVAEMIKFYLDSDVNVGVYEMFRCLAEFGLIKQSMFDTFSYICGAWKLSADGKMIVDDATGFEIAVLNDENEWEAVDHEEVRVDE